MSDPAPHVFSGAYYARLADIEEHHWWSEGMRAIQRRLLDRLAKPRPAWRVLDSGCGTGLTLTWARQFTARDPIGLDRAAAGLDFCRSRGHRRLIEGDATELPFSDAQFDLVLSCDVIQHLPRPLGDARALAEIARVLVPGGCLLLRTNSRCGYPDEEPEPDYHRYVLTELAEKFAAAGLQPVRLSYVNCLPALALSLQRRLKGQRLSGSDPGLAARPRRSALTGGLLSRVLRVEGWLLHHFNVSLPYGHSIVALVRKAG